MSALNRVLRSHGTAEVRLAEGDSEPGHEFATGQLVQAVDACLDEACRLFRLTDFSGCPPEIQQAINLVFAAELTTDGLVEHCGLPDPDSDVGFSNWVEDTAYDPLAVALAGKDDDGPSTSQGPGEQYSDPGWQKDGKKRYPTTEGGSLSEKRIRAAWSYINQGENAKEYSPQQVAQIKAKIKAAASKAGVKIDDSADNKVKASYVALAFPMGSEHGAKLASMHHGSFTGKHAHPHPFDDVHAHDHFHNGESDHFHAH